MVRSDAVEPRSPSPGNRDDARLLEGCQAGPHAGLGEAGATDQGRRRELTPVARQLAEDPDMGVAAQDGRQGIAVSTLRGRARHGCDSQPCSR